MVLISMENGQTWCYQLNGTNKSKEGGKTPNQPISKRWYLELWRFFVGQRSGHEQQGRAVTILSGQLISPFAQVAVSWVRLSRRRREWDQVA